MPAVIYIFSLCTFTFGLSEFVVAGLVSAISMDLHESISQVGSAIAAYALGAAIGAPIITALLANWRDKTVLLLTLGVLAAGSVAISLAPDVLTLHGCVSSSASHMGYSWPWPPTRRSNWSTRCAQGERYRWYGWA